jgi:hypothetical protein
LPPQHLFDPPAAPACFGESVRQVAEAQMVVPFGNDVENVCSLAWGSNATFGTLIEELLLFSA